MHKPDKSNTSGEKIFNGELVVSDIKKSIPTSASADIKNNKISVSFLFEGELIVFTASKNENGRLEISEKVMDDFILTGVSRVKNGKKSPQVQINKELTELRFHLVIDFFTGVSKEIYFSGSYGKAPKKKQKRNFFLRSVAGLAA